MIDDHALATKRFTVSYLFPLNRCRQLAIDDPSNIITAEYWQRYRAARNEFNEVNDEIKCGNSAAASTYTVNLKLLNLFYLHLIKTEREVGWG